MTGVFFSAERAKLYDYSAPLVFDNVVIAVAKGKDFPFEKAADLAGKKIGLQGSFFYGDEFTAVIPQLTVDGDTSPSVRVKKLSAGRIDAALFNPGKSAFANSVKEAGLSADDFTVLPKPLAKLSNHLIVGKKRRWRCGDTGADQQGDCFGHRRRHAGQDHGEIRAIGRSIQLT